MSAYILVAATIIASMILFNIYGLDKNPKFFEGPVLYYGSAVIQAYAALVAVPFAIWVIYMQSRYGPFIVRIFLNKVIYPFTIFAIITGVSALTISMAHTESSYIAFMIEFTVSLAFLPPLINYIRGLMTMGPEDVVIALQSTARSTEDFIVTSLQLLKLYMVEAYPHEDEINRILRRVANSIRDAEKLKINPEIWHRFRDLLKTIVTEATILPDKKVMRSLMLRFLIWLILNNRDKTARSFIRYYRLVTLRYMEERLPSEVIEDLFLEPTLGVLKSIKPRKDLIAYTLEQTYSLLVKLRKAGRTGDITSRELCRTLLKIDRYTEGLEEVGELYSLKKMLTSMRREFQCPKLPQIKCVGVKGG